MSLTQEQIIEKIQFLIKTFPKEEKLYYMIFDLLSNKNELNNYSVNKTGIRFKLNEFSNETLSNVLLILTEYIKNEEDFIEEIKPKKKRSKKI
jgi:hypothetical protein